MTCIYLGEYTKRNLLRWLKQYESSKTSDVSEIEQLIEWLPKHLPDRERCTLVHGDYRIDNLVFSYDSPPRVIAVLDWEISTIGDPLTDLATCLFAHYQGKEPEILPGSLFFSYSKCVLCITGLYHRTDQLKSLGIPTVEQFIDEYCRLSRIAPIDRQTWTFYVAFVCFRFAAIVQGVYKRSLQGFVFVVLSN